MNTRWTVCLTVVMLAVARIGGAQAVVTNFPGTPTTNWSNPGGAEVIIPEGGGIGVQPISTFNGSFTAIPGDVVMIIDPNGGANRTNWQAVVNFFNPSDPTGTNGLAATEYQTFFPATASSSYFAGIPLFTNVAYCVPSATNADGSITTDCIEYGPDGGILSGQEALFLLTASIQPNPFEVTITSPTSGQQASNQASEVTVEFTGAIPGRVYAIQYSSDLETWLTASPTISAVTNSVQWIDAGPPQTDSSPAQQSARYYRVALLPAN
jgi:hypothetical protein